MAIYMQRGCFKHVNMIYYDAAIPAIYYCHKSTTNMICKKQIRNIFADRVAQSTFVKKVL